MRARLTVLGAVLLLSGCGGSSTTHDEAASPTATAGTCPSGHGDRRASRRRGSMPRRARRRANARWRYRVVVTDKKGRKLAGKITVQIVDPLGQAHAATYDDTTKPITNLPFRGQFQDYVEYPADSRGYTLTFRVIAKTPKGTVTITYPVTAK